MSEKNVRSTNAFWRNAFSKAGRRRLNTQADFRQGSSFELIQELVTHVSGVPVTAVPVPNLLSLSLRSGF